MGRASVFRSATVPETPTASALAMVRDVAIAS